MAWSKALLTDFGIQHRLKSCEQLEWQFLFRYGMYCQVLKVLNVGKQEAPVLNIISLKTCRYLNKIHLNCRFLNGGALSSTSEPPTHHQVPRINGDPLATSTPLIKLFSTPSSRTNHRVLLRGRSQDDERTQRTFQTLMQRGVSLQAGEATPLQSMKSYPSDTGTFYSVESSFNILPLPQDPSPSDAPPVIVSQPQPLEPSQQPTYSVQTNGINTFEENTQARAPRECSDARLEREEVVITNSPDVITNEPAELARPPADTTFNDKVWTKWAEFHAAQDENDIEDSKNVLCCSKLQRLRPDQVDLCNRKWFYRKADDTKDDEGQEEQLTCWRAFTNKVTLFLQTYTRKTII